MRLETILNQTEKHKSFVYGSGHLEEGASGRTMIIVNSAEPLTRSRVIWRKVRRDGRW